MEEAFNPIDSSLLEDLPILYRVLRKVNKSKLKRISLIESNFHQTKYLESINFYKPISQIIEKDEE
jgi:hypothetical protein